jgi:hypothetical protein
MVFRIRSVFRPFAYSLAFLLDRTGIPPTPFVWISYGTGIFGFLAFFLLVDTPSSNLLQNLAILCLLGNGLATETVREFAERHNVISELERVEFFFDKYTDFFIILGVTFFVASERYYGPPGLMVPGPAAAFIMAAIIAGGAILQDLLEAEDGNRIRGERMYILGIFALGAKVLPSWTFDPFQDYLFSGMLLMSVITLSSIGGHFFHIKRPERLPEYSPTIPRPSIPRLPFKDGLKRIMRLVDTVGSAATASRRRPPADETETYTPPPREEEPPEPDEDLPRHNFTAVVTDKSQDEGIPDAEVSLMDKETGRGDTAFTDPEGRITFKDVAEGQYVITASAEGYDGKDFDRYISSDSGGIMALTRSAQDLSIIVNDEAKMRPVAEAVVTLKSKKTGSAFMRRTDNLGVAYFEGLEAAAYFMEVEATGYEMAKDGVDLEKENVASVALKPKESPFDRPDIGILGEAALIEYTSKDSVEDVLEDIIKDYRSEERDVCLVTSPSKIKVYANRMEGVGLVVLPTEGEGPGPDQVVIEIPMTHLEYFKEVFEGMPPRSVFIFEPLSNLILNIGVDDAYHFCSNTLDQLSGLGITFICLINNDVHDRREVSGFENLFMKLARVKGKGLKGLK